jgi:hypothetical protein
MTVRLHSHAEAVDASRATSGRIVGYSPRSGWIVKFTPAPLGAPIAR